MRLLALLLELSKVGLRLAAFRLLLVHLLVAELERGVAVALLRPVAEDQVRGGFHHGDGDGGAVLRKYRRHADLLADQTLRHRVLLALPTRVIAAQLALGRGCGRHVESPREGFAEPLVWGPRLLTRGKGGIKLGKSVPFLAC